MELGKEFFDKLEKLKNFKTKPELNDFFEVINKLEKIGAEITADGKKPSTNSSNLIKQAQDLTRKLEIKKDQIALCTKTQKEFDTVYECIDYLDMHFNSLN